MGSAFAVAHGVFAELMGEDWHDFPVPSQILGGGEGGALSNLTACLVDDMAYSNQ
jgi:hypothetical protein